MQPRFSPADVAAPAVDFDFAQYTLPFFEGCVVYHETVGFVQDAAGGVTSGQLLYTPQRILSVRSFDRKTVYLDGKDWLLQGRRIVLPADSAIRAMPYELYAPPRASSANDETWRYKVDDPTRYIAAPRDGANVPLILRHQISVSYTHRDGWSRAVPTPSLSALPKTKEKLKAQRDLTVLFLGDSITAGYEASGCAEFDVDRQTLKMIPLNGWDGAGVPAWAELVCRGLRRFGGRVEKINRASAGSATFWCLCNLEKLLTLREGQPTPDLVVIAYGMNQPNDSAAKFRRDVEAIMDGVRAFYNAAPEFLLVSCMTANREAHSLSQPNFQAFEGALFEIAAARPGVAVAPVNTMFRALEAAGKHYHDFSGNGLNHPNDFAVRLYAQTILKTLS